MSGRYDTLKTRYEFPEGEMWLWRRSQKYSRDTAKQARIALEQFDAFLVVNDFPSIEAIDNQGMEDFSLFLKDEEYGNLAESTLEKRWYAVRKYLNDHIDEDVGWLEGDDWILEWTDGETETVKERRLEIHWLEIPAIHKLIEGASEHPITPLRNELIVRILWNTGCRPSEVARMQKDRVDLSTRSIEVKSSKSKGKDKKDRERTVFFTRETRRLMREWLKRGGRDSLVTASESIRLFPGYNSTSISSRQVNSIVRQAADAAGIQEESIKRADGVTINRVTPKALRHSFAVWSVRPRSESGTPSMDLVTLMKLMGHSSLETVRQYLMDDTLGAKFDECFPD